MRTKTLKLTSYKRFIEWYIRVSKSFDDLHLDNVLTRGDKYYFTIVY